MANDGVPDFLFHNVGNGRFTERALAAGVSVASDGKARAGTGTAFGDVDGDGRLDLVVTNHEAEMHTLFRLVTFTWPRDLRALAFAHQRVADGVLMRSAAAALQRLAADPRDVGARLGCLAVLHTWTRAMLYHPHVHLLVTAGGLSPDGTQWIAPRNPAFLVPVHAVSIIFRARTPVATLVPGIRPTQDCVAASRDTNSFFVRQPTRGGVPRLLLRWLVLPDP